MSTYVEASGSESAKFGKATIYMVGEFFGNYRKIEVREGELKMGPYAQYAKAAHVMFKRPRERNARGFTDAGAVNGMRVIILEGWGHPEPDGMFGEAREVEGGLEVSQSKYSAFDDGWDNDFNSKMNAYLASKGSAVTVIADLRGLRAGMRP